VLIWLPLTIGFSSELSRFPLPSTPLNCVGGRHLGCSASPAENEPIFGSSVAPKSPLSPSASRAIFWHRHALRQCSWAIDSV